METISTSEDGATAVGSVTTQARVLIVESVSLIRAGIRALLSDPGIEILGEAPNGQEGLLAFRALRPNIVLTAIHIGELNGIQLTSAIKAESPETAVVVLTYDNDPNDVRQAIEAGATGYLLKTTSADLLVQAVKLAQAGESLIDGNVLHALSGQHEGILGLEVPSAVIAGLSPRELEVLRHLAAGMTNKEIAKQMHYSVGTVKNVVQRTIEKLGVSDRTQAAVLAVRAGLTGL